MNNSENFIEIKVYDRKTNNILNKSIDDLIPEMVAGQINIDFELEAIKVQTIIARTALVKKAKIFGGKGCSTHPQADICLENYCDNWLSKEKLKERWGKDFEKNWQKLLKAEQETKHLIITFNNKVIDPRFHITCGGATENSENVDDSKVIYLRRVLCSYCVDSPYWRNVKELTLEEIEEKLNVKFNKPSPLYQANIEGIVEEIERDDEGRVKKIKVGDKVFKGTEFCQSLGLDSTRFGFKPVGLRFETRGRGDGLGLCQYGANQMAVEGKSSEEILKYYYTGIDIKEYEKPNKNKPMSNKVIVLDPGHGGKENVGVIGKQKLLEKDLTLAIAVNLKAALEGLGAKSVLTRETDEYLSLNNRAKITNEVRPNFFISIHMNSFKNESISGIEIYHYRGDKEGEVLANFIIESMSQHLESVNRGVKTADFYLLKTVTTSALQIEVAYLSNPQEENKFLDDNYVKRVADSIAEGITKYYKYQI